MSLRLQINLVLTLIIGLLAAALVWQQVRGLRTSVGQEMQTAGQVAVQMLSRVQAISQDEAPEAMISFLDRLGRVVANDLVLLDAQGTERYRSPASPEKGAQGAPAWFAAWIAPTPQVQELALPRARLVVTGDASGAARAAWETFKRQILIITLGVAALTLLGWWLVGRVVQPLRQLGQALEGVERGGAENRLPSFAGAEVNTLASGFNRLIIGVGEGISAREETARLTAELTDHLEQSEAYRERVAQESDELAAELHDELSPHVTAIKSMGVSIARRVDDDDPAISQAARLIVQSADRLHLAVRGMLNRLRPVALDQFGLGDALTGLVGDLRLQFPDKQFVLRIGPEMEQIEPAVATSAFSLVQEAITNALRHANATAIDVNLRRLENTLVMQVEDNGHGMDEQVLAKGGFGLAGMRERVASAGGRLEVGRSRQGGVLVRARLPLPGTDTERRTASR